MLHCMRRTPAFLRVPVALIAAAIMLVAVPLHAAHVHHEDGAASNMHAPCAACQVYAPAGTPPDADALRVEPECSGHFVDNRTDVPLAGTHGRIDACRAPPSLLA